MSELETIKKEWSPNLWSECWLNRPANYGGKILLVTDVAVAAKEGRGDTIPLLATLLLISFIHHVLRARMTCSKGPQVKTTGRRSEDTGSVNGAHTLATDLPRCLILHDLKMSRSVTTWIVSSLSHMYRHIKKIMCLHLFFNMQKRTVI